jgi:hypothetical protein
MDAGVAQLGHQANVALDDAGLGLGGMPRRPSLNATAPAFMLAPVRHARVFGVLDHGQAHARRGGQGLAHDVVFEDGQAVVGDGTAPADLRAAKSLMASPLDPRVAAAMGKTRTDAPRSGACIQRVISGESFTGLVLGMAATR